jgi:hypothetical protein
MLGLPGVCTIEESKNRLEKIFVAQFSGITAKFTFGVGVGDG